MGADSRLEGRGGAPPALFVAGTRDPVIVSPLVILSPLGFPRGLEGSLTNSNTPQEVRGGVQGAGSRRREQQNRQMQSNAEKQD